MNEKMPTPGNIPNEKRKAPFVVAGLAAGITALGGAEQANAQTNSESVASPAGHEVHEEQVTLNFSADELEQALANGGIPAPDQESLTQTGQDPRVVYTRMIEDAFSFLDQQVAESASPEILQMFVNKAQQIRDSLPGTSSTLEHFDQILQSAQEAAGIDRPNPSEHEGTYPGATPEQTETLDQLETLYDALTGYYTEYYNSDNSQTSEHNVNMTLSQEIGGLVSDVQFKYERLQQGGYDVAEKIEYITEQLKKIYELLPENYKGEISKKDQGLPWELLQPE